jgi:hypothetical protein
VHPISVMVSALFLDPISLTVGVLALLAIAGYAAISIRLARRKRERASAPPAYVRPDAHTMSPPRRRGRSDGMTWTALVLLVAVLAFLGWNIYSWNDARTPPSGASVQSATVDDTYDPSRPRPGSRNRNFLVVQFHLDDGETGEALYEQRFIGGADTGDTIEVYRDGDTWRTTSEESPWGAIGSGLGALLVLVMIYGWFRVRRAKPDETPPPPAPVRRDGPDGI